MTDTMLDNTPLPGSLRPSRLLHWGGLLATLLAFAFAVLMSIRPISSYDMGYHLAYGEKFLDTGQIVQSNEFIYTRLDAKRLADPNELGPGCRYDEASGTYYFINANWLSQVGMAAVHRYMGLPGLEVLQSALVAAVFVLMILTLRHHQVPWHLVAALVLLGTLCMYERFNLRPENFGYVVLAAQFLLLVSRRFGWRAIAALVGLQVLAANFHSYFLLGIALAGAMFAGQAALWVWDVAVRQQPSPRRKRLALLYGVATAAVIAASFVNPWTYRGAYMPIQTLLFLRAHDITGQYIGSPMEHPWSTIGEFYSPFARDMSRTITSFAFYAMLGLASPMAVLAAWRGRLGWLLSLAGMLVISLKMRRNIAPAAMILMPLYGLILRDAVGLRGRLRQAEGGMLAWLKRFTSRAGRPAAVALLSFTLMVSGLCLYGVLTNQLYYQDRRSWRLGRGLSHVAIPLSAAAWINQHQPVGRLFSDYDSSSNIMYYTRPHREVPILTNTWAYPPYVMGWVLDMAALAQDPGPVLNEYQAQMVLVHSSAATRRLIRYLSSRPEWALVDLDVRHVLFARRDGPNAELVARCELKRRGFDLEQYIRKIGRCDNVPEFALHVAANMLLQMNWSEHAIAIWERVLQTRERYPECHFMLGTCLAIRGTGLLELMQDRLQKAKDEPDPKAKQALKQQAGAMYQVAVNDWDQAEKHLLRAIELWPTYRDARDNLDLLRKQKNDLRHGVISIPQWMP